MNRKNWFFFVFVYAAFSDDVFAQDPALKEATRIESTIAKKVQQGWNDDLKELRAFQASRKSKEGASKIETVSPETTKPKAVQADESDKINKRILNSYRFAEAHCYAQLNVKLAELSYYRKLNTKISATGKLIALIGAVTVHPAGKTLLMGIGLGGSDSVLGVYNDYSSETVEQLKADVIVMRSRVDSEFIAVDGIRDDDDGNKRSIALTRLGAICDGFVQDASQLSEGEKENSDKKDGDRKDGDKKAGVKKDGDGKDRPK